MLSVNENIFFRSAFGDEKKSRHVELLRSDSAIVPERPCFSDTAEQCRVFNCPWLKYHIEEDQAPMRNDANMRDDRECVLLSEARRDISKNSEFPFVPPENDDLPDHIFNITFNFAFGSSINGIKFKYPVAPFYSDASFWKAEVEQYKEFAKTHSKGK